MTLTAQTPKGGKTMKFATLRVFLFVLAVATFLSVPAMAQVTPGSVSGTVVDPTGAVVPGATVELIDPATGFVRVQDTNDSGQFSFERVSSRTYTLRISKQGFRVTEVKDIEVSTGKVTSLGNVRLEVGATGETVTVEATATPLVQAESAQITGNYSSRTVSETTFGFFGVDAIAFLTPGVLPGGGFTNTNGGIGNSGFGDQTGTSSSISSNGMRSRSNNFTIDGQSNNDISIGGPGFFVGNLETVQEYQITTNQFNADQGRNMGATINIITKSGTNDVHGSVYWFHQNSAVQSRSASESQSEADKPAPLKYNEAGFTVGGPVVKNKLFFFGGFRIYRNPAAVTATSGNLAITDTGLNNLETLFGPSNTIDIYRANGPLQRPFGNPQCIPGTEETLTGTSPDEACLITRLQPQSDEIEDFNARLDWVGKKQSLYGRYIFQDETFCCESFAINANAAGFAPAVPSRSQALALTHTYQISPRMLNEFRFAFTRLFVTFEGGQILGLGDVTGNLTRLNMPSGFISIGTETNLPQGRGVTDFQYQDNWSLVHGRHTFKAGIDFRRNRTFAPFLPNVNGAFTFSSLGDFANNIPSTFAFAAGPFAYSPFETDQFYFFQDDIRLRPNLTLNLGIRYENNGQPVNGIHEETVARESDPTQAIWLQSLPLDRRTYRKTPRDDNNWGPRLGFAYTPRWGKALFGEDKTVIRGGYGIAYEVTFYNLLLNTATAAPRVFGFSNTGCAGNVALCPPIPGTGTGAEVAAIAVIPSNRCDPTGGSSPIMGLTTLGCDHDLNAATGRLTFNQTQVSKDFHSPYAQSWSLGIQRELGRSAVFEVRYVGTKATGQFQNVDQNPRARMIQLGSGFFGASGPCPAGTIRTANLGSAASTNNFFNTGAFTAFNCITLAGRPELIPSNVTVCTDPTASGFNGIDCSDITAGRNLTRANTGSSIYHALQSRLDVRNWRNQLTGGLGYTWSKNIENSSEAFGGSGSPSLAQNVFDINQGERGLAIIDIRHATTVYAIWDMPWRRDQKGAVGKILGGWELTGTGVFYTGRPWTPTQFFAGGANSRLFGYGGQNPFCATSPRNDVVCRPHLGNPNAPLDTVGFFAMINGVPTLLDFTAWNTASGCNSPVDCSNVVVPITADQVHWIINNAESVLAGFPVFGTDRNMSSTTGDGTHLVNLGIFKNTYVGSENQVNIQFRTQLVNAFNHRNYGRPDRFIDDAGFGFGDFRNVGASGALAPGRLITFGLRVIF